LPLALIAPIAHHTLMDESSPIIWAVADTRRGVENQALGLAEAIADQTGGRVARATLRKDGYAALPDSEAPDIWIGCGRPAIALARRQRRAFANSLFVYVQDPRGSYDVFDLVVAPAHDNLRRRNAVSIIGSPHRVSRDRLDADIAKFSDHLERYSGPRAAVMIGGPSKRFKFTAETGKYLETRISGLLDNDLSVMVSVSRRTPDRVRQQLAQRYADHPRVWWFDGEGDNPYFAFLGAADWIFVTEDSTNMLVEAAATGTPVYSLALPGSAGKFAQLHAALEGHGALRPYLGRHDTWTYEPLNETRLAAEAVITRWRNTSPPS